jgi:hydroxyethylthiazole kinase-like uncharacterized protein yjeF
LQGAYFLCMALSDRADCEREGRMTELLTAAQMRAIEQAAIASGQVTGPELMERAGRGVVEAVFEEWPDLRATSHRAVVLCGPGNNGGDGFVVARLLKEWGWEVEVFLYGDAEKLPPDSRVNYERWLAMGEVRALAIAHFPRLHEVHTDLFVDALFGTGLSRQPVGELSEVLVHIRCAIWPYERSLRKPEHLVAIDVPTGLCADSGRVIDGPASGLAHFRADLTVTFHQPKVGHFIADGPELAGKVVVRDIGLRHGVGGVNRRAAAAPKTPTARLVEAWRADFGKEGGHKYTHGHALILSGPSGRGGAARLAARGALRIGAGVVTVGCPPDAIPENAARLDAVMLRPIGDADVLARVLEDGRINALCLGPGMGTGDREAGLLAQALSSGRKLVLDADALTLLARDPALVAALHPGCVLTPHAGEFARAFPDLAEKLAAPETKGPAYSKVDATREAAARAGCVVLYKGPDTVIADPSGRCAINSAAYDRAAPWLATAGSGDVLAGFICGLLARGFGPFDAACAAAWLHVECALSFGPGLIAEDLPEELPRVFRALGL